LTHKLDGIVTRDEAGFRGSPIPIFSPDALLAQLAKQNP
jgi:hypothetical protein